MADVEGGNGRRGAGRKQQQRGQQQNAGGSSNVPNPYSTTSSSSNPTLLPRYHPLNILRRCLYMGISLYGLHYYDTYHTIQHSSHIKHEYFKIGLASTIGTLPLYILCFIQESVFRVYVYSRYQSNAPSPLSRVKLSHDVRYLLYVS